MTNPSVTPLFSGSQILILISPPRLVMTCPHGLSASSPSTPLPATHPAPSTLVLAAVPTHTRHVTSAASAQSLLITEGFPDPGEKKDSKLFPRPSLPSRNLWPTIGFLPSAIVCLPPRRQVILPYIFHSCFPTPRTMLCRDLIPIFIFLTSTQSLIEWIWSNFF